ncbi:inositol monophosphatase [Candidatus Peregrinibacteria bacterium]|nr:inositol monophosphatase [Candidatus Peregrinibacteria bacterium]
MPSHLLQISKKLAHDAGLVALDMQKKGFKIENKNGTANFVTDADKACEKLIVDTIRNNFPDHSVLSEEMGEIKGAGEYKWIVDPIDGTTNFAHGLPIFGISIAIVKNGKPIIGVVEIPGMKETFWAMQGRGAHLGNAKIKVSKTSELKNSLLATGFPYARAERYKKNIELFDAFYNVSHGVRRIGAASVDLCYLACGRFDAYWEFDLKAWDVAAGKIIVEEAGGTVTNMDGSTLDPKRGSLLSTNSILHQQMLNELKKRGADKL